MFTMMNNARLGVGAQGIGLAEAAYQHALAHCEGAPAGPARAAPAPSSSTPDVRRMLAEAKAEIFAARAIALACGVAIDRATAGGGEGWEARAAFLTPHRQVATGARQWAARVADRTWHSRWHGGMGYIEEDPWGGRNHSAGLSTTR